MVKKTKKPTDINKLAASIVNKATVEKEEREKNPAAVALGKLGGKKGGLKRAEALSAERRREIALLAAHARWESHSRKK